MKFHNTQRAFSSNCVYNLVHDKEVLPNSLVSNWKTAHAAQREIQQLPNVPACPLEGLAYKTHSMKCLSIQFATLIMVSEL